MAGESIFVALKRADCDVRNCILEIFLWMSLDVPHIRIRNGIIFFAECFRRDTGYIAHLFISLADTHGGIQSQSESVRQRRFALDFVVAVWRTNGAESV